MSGRRQSVLVLAHSATFCSPAIGLGVFAKNTHLCPMQHCLLKVICSFLLFFVLNDYGQAQTAKFNPADTAYGSPGGIVTINFELTPPADMVPKGHSLEKWGKLLPPGDTVWSEGWQRLGTKWVLPIRIMCLDLVQVPLPTFEVEVDFEEKPITLSPDKGVFLQIDSFPLTNFELAPIKDIIAEKANFWDYIPKPVFFGLLAMLILVLALFFYFKKKRNKGNAAMQKKHLNPREKALLRLDELKKMNLPAQGEWKAYYSSLTFILREYMESGQSIKALDATSDELLVRVKNRLSEQQFATLRQFLFRADLVKFAKGLPPESYAEEAFAWVEKYVKSK